MTLVRTLHPDFEAAILGPYFWPVVMLYLDWPVTPIRAHSNTGTLVWDGNDWLGVGGFGELQLPDDTSDLASFGGSVTLSGLPGDMDDFLDDDIRGRDATVYIGAVTERGGSVLIGTPQPIMVGVMDGMRERLTKMGGPGLELMRAVNVGLSSGPGQRSSARLSHTVEDQEAAYPADTAGRLVLMAEAYAGKLQWPKP